MTSKPVNFGIVSPARWGRLLLDAGAKLDNLNLRGVCSRSAGNAQEVAAAYGGQVYLTYNAMLEDPEIDAVLLPTPNFLHHSQAMAAFRTGKHVFVEKPIANTLDEAYEMQRTARERGLVLAVGMQGRRTGAARMVKQMLADRKLGRVGMAVAVHGAPLLNTRSEDSWYYSADKAPGGPLDQLGVHYFDLLRYFFGPVRRVTGAYTRRHAPYDVPDTASALLEMDDGTLAVYNTHQISAYVSNLTIYGTLGAVHFNRFGQELLWEDVIPPAAAKKDGPQIQTLEIQGPHPFTTALQEELAEFADCILTGETPSVGVREGIAALRVARAVMEAHDTGRAIVLDE